jgi:hypothetical protein
LKQIKRRPVRYGLLDADYERLVAGGANLWASRADRTPR